jgi:voltage-dependent anion channel protein 2
MACNPVKYDDLGKDAKDLLNKNFHFGVIKLEGKTKSSAGVDFTVDGVHTAETGNVHGGLESKYKNKDFTFTEKWTTDNLITTNVSIEDKVVKGLKADFDVSFAPSTGKKSAKVKTAFKHDYFHSTHDVDLDFAGPTFHGSAVAGYKGALVGGQAVYDTASSKLTTTSLSFAYHGDFKVHSGIVDFSKYFGSIHHQVNDSLGAGASLTWANGGSSPALTVGAQYASGPDSFWKAKIDNNLRLGISYVTKLREGVQITLSSLLNAKALNGGGHKVGLSLNLDA